MFPNAQRGKAGNPKPKANTIDTSKVRQTFNWQPIAEKDTVCVGIGCPRSSQLVTDESGLVFLPHSLDMVKSLAEYQKTRWQ